MPLSVSQVVKSKGMTATETAANNWHNLSLHNGAKDFFHFNPIFHFFGKLKLIGSGLNSHIFLKSLVSI